MSLLDKLPIARYNQLLQEDGAWARKLAARLKINRLYNKEVKNFEELLDCLSCLGYSVERMERLLVKCPKTPKTSVALKVAVLVANERYDSWLRLRTPANDCRKMADALAGIGFVVVLLRDAEAPALRMSLQKICRAIPPRSYVLFFFAGHGIEVRNTKYTVGVESPLNNYTDDNLVSEQFIKKCAFDTDPELTVILLDTCRTQPRSANLEINRDEPPVEGHRNLIFGCSTSPYMESFECPDITKTTMTLQHTACCERSEYKVNDDDNIKGTTPYVKSLCSHLKKNENFVNILERVQQDFAEMKCEEDKRQKPEKLDNVGAPFYLNIKTKGDEKAIAKLKCAVEELVKEKVDAAYHDLYNTTQD